MAKKVTPTYSNDEIREMILEYFYDRNNTATSVSFPFLVQIKSRFSFI